MWPSLFTLMVVSSPGPTTPMNWMSLGRSEAAESVNALHTVLEREERIDNAELKALAATFKPQTTDEEEPELELAESVADASDRVGDVRGKIDRVDALLSRLRLQDDQ